MKETEIPPLKPKQWVAIALIVYSMFFLAIMSPAARGSEIEGTYTGLGTTTYLLNCTATCTLNITGSDGALLYSATYSAGMQYGNYSGTPRLMNLTLYHGGVYQDHVTLTSGTFNTGFAEAAEARVGRPLIGVAIMLGVALTAATLGLEAGILILGLGMLTAGETGYFPTWPGQLLLLIAGLVFAIGAYKLFGKD